MLPILFRILTTNMHQTSHYLQVNPSDKVEVIPGEMEVVVVDSAVVVVGSAVAPREKFKSTPRYF